MIEAKSIIQLLLESKAIHINENELFTWASGIKSPIYCDNRQLISYPEKRTIIVDAFVDYIQKHYPNTQCIAGTATAGIPWTAWVADRLNLPMIYVRSSSKGHGLKNLIEGNLIPKSNIIVIEDLISTGGSALKVIEAIEQKANVLALLSIFNYQLNSSRNNFKDKGFNVHSLAYKKDLELYTGKSLEIPEL